MLSASLNKTFLSLSHLLDQSIVHYHVVCLFVCLLLGLFICLFVFLCLFFLVGVFVLLFVCLFGVFFGVFVFFFWGGGGCLFVFGRFLKLFFWVFFFLFSPVAHFFPAVLAHGTMPKYLYGQSAPDTTQDITTHTTKLEDAYVILDTAAGIKHDELYETENNILYLLIIMS